MFLRILWLLLAGILPMGAQPRAFRVDEQHTVFGFKASTLLFDVSGRFMRCKVDIQGDPTAPGEAKVRIELDARSIHTTQAKRDEHLRSADFFDVAKHPKILFTSQDVQKDGDHVRVRGTLTMHGVTQDLDLSFLLTEGVNGAGVPTWSYRATLPLDRLDYDLGAENVAAKIGLRRQVELDLLLVGFFEDAPPAPVKALPAPKRAASALGRKGR